MCAAVPGISVNQGLPECSTESEVQRVLGLAPGDPWQTIQMSDGLFTYPPPTMFINSSKVDLSSSQRNFQPWVLELVYSGWFSR